MSERIWRAFPGFEAGEVRRDAPGLNARIGQLRRAGLNKDGYRQVCLYPGKVTRRIAPAVARAFLGPPPRPGMELNHKNGVRGDDRVENLEWTSHKENVRHSLRALGATRASGERNGQAKLTAAEVVEIRNLAASGATHKALAVRFGVGKTTVGNIVARRFWRHV